jgi:hypothetical protein
VFYSLKNQEYLRNTTEMRIHNPLAGSLSDLCLRQRSISGVAGFLFFETVLVSFLLFVYGCRNRSYEPIHPPRKKQQEKQYISQDEKKLGKTTPVTAEAAEDSKKNNAACKITISVSADKFRNISKVELNGVNGNGFLDNSNFVTRWNILGPFPCGLTLAEKNALAGKAALHRKLIKNEKKLSGIEKTAEQKWLLARFESSSRPGEINLRNFFRNKPGQLAAYAVTYLQCSKKMSHLTLYTGSSGYIKVWINHQLVHTYDHNYRQGKWDQDVIQNIELRKGYNQIVVKCVSTAEDWNFYFRLADAQNLPMKFIPFQNPTTSKQLLSKKD